MDNKNFYMRKDVILFNLLMLLLLVSTAVVMLYTPAIGSFNMFIPFSCLIFVIIFTYTFCLQRGLMLSIVVTFIYGSYVIYQTTVVNSSTEINFAFISWLLFFPLSSIITGNFSLVIKKYKRGMDERNNLEQLIAVDAGTGFYKNQEFFKRLEDEFKRAKRYKTSFSVLLIQISNFEELRIIYGEVDSINIMRKVAEIIEKDVRSTDSKFLLADNMLGIILTETDLDGAKIVIEKLHMSLDRITAEVRNGVKKVVRIKPHIGYSHYRENDIDALVVYDRALEELNYDKG